MYYFYYKRITDYRLVTKFVSSHLDHQINQRRFFQKSSTLARMNPSLSFGFVEQNNTYTTSTYATATRFRRGTSIASVKLNKK